MIRFLFLAATSLFLSAQLFANGINHLVFEPPIGKDNGKRIVLVSGDEEYRSEESCPMLAKILSQRHGFHCTVLFAIDQETGTINPNEVSNIPHLESLREADLLILNTRFRKLPGEQLQHILDYLNSAKPLIAIRTATHAFNNDDQYGGYDWKNFGLNVIGENWLNHHGKHKVQGGRGVIESENKDHPILNAVSDIFTPSDIYGIANLDQSSATVLLRGAVTESLDPNSPLLEGSKNKPMMPLAWLKDYPSPDGLKTGRCFATTAGAAIDFAWEDLRRLLVNASFHLTDLEVPKQADVTPVDPYSPKFYGFHEKDYFKNKNIQVSEFSLHNTIESQLALNFRKGERIVLLGNGLPERMLRYGHFETELFRRNPEKDLVIRTLAFPGFTAGFRPHPSRNSQWAFPGAEAFHPEFSHHSGSGHYPADDIWLSNLRADTIFAFYGFNESFRGRDGLEAFKGELSKFVDHTLSQAYNGNSPPRLVLVSPIAFQNLSSTHDLPDGSKENENLQLYANAMASVASEKGIGFIDLLSPTFELFQSSTKQLTVNGAHLNEQGYARLASILADRITGPENGPLTESDLSSLTDLVRDKNYYWFHRYQMPNGVHSYGRRWEPFGNENYPDEAEKLNQLTQNRDRAIWNHLQSKPFDLAAADAATHPLTPIQTNAPERASNTYRYGQDAVDSISLADGYEIEMFASEVEFPNLANPVQLSFDNKGRLWVAVMPSYPHYRPGDPKPNDKLLVYEDTDGDGRADKETVFAKSLHLPIGFELVPDGVIISQAPDLVLLRDSDGDGRADSREILLSGFDTHDTHHAISAFTADPTGAILMCEGVFLHTNVETAYGPVRGVNGGFYRYAPHTQRLERIVQTTIPNPWGIAIDEWGQEFFLSTSNPDVHWMLPFQVRAKYGQLINGSESLVESEHRVRPTSGIEFVSSRHFPDEVQGDFILNNNIGFIGAKQHSLEDSGADYSSAFRHDLFTSNDPNFRPVDLEFAPDGSLFVADWHNQLIGHMQHSARDPLRDHAHGRIYRITYPDRPLVEPCSIDGSSIADLLDILKTPEYRSRYRARRELRERPAELVHKEIADWIENLDTNDPLRERHLLEGLWVLTGFSKFDRKLLESLLAAKTPQVRAAAVRVLRNLRHQIPDHISLLKTAASDSNPRVRLEATIAATWLNNEQALEIVETAGKLPLDSWSKKAHEQALSNLGRPASNAESEETPPPEYLTDHYKKKWQAGAEIYHREGHCATCHQPDGKGLPSSGYPPLDGSEWVNENADRLIDLTLRGLVGPISVKGRSYPGHVPMTPFHGILNDEEIASVLTYIRNAFGNQSEPIDPEAVKRVRESSKDKKDFWTAEDLKKKYP